MMIKKNRYVVFFIIIIFLSSIGVIYLLKIRNSGEGEFSKPNILLIVVDTLRQDHVGLYGYERDTTPNIDSWFGGGVIFENAYSGGSRTPEGTVSFLSGLLSVDHRVRNFYILLPDNISIISDILSDEGYQTAAVVSNYVLTREAMGLDNRFDYFDDYMENREIYRREIHQRIAENTTKAALLWSLTNYTREKPYFLWVHYQDPHGPYLPPVTIRDFTHESPVILHPDQIPVGYRHNGVFDGLEYVDLYDEEIAYTDYHIGVLLENFKSQGLLENTIIIFTSDHGEELMEPNRNHFFQHGHSVYNELVNVPLIIKYKKLQGSRVSIPVSTIDILPTVINLTHSKSRILPGRNIIGVDEIKPVFAESSNYGNPEKTMIIDENKWIFSVNETNQVTKKTILKFSRKPFRVANQRNEV